LEGDWKTHTTKRRNGKQHGLPCYYHILADIDDDNIVHIGTKKKKKKKVETEIHARQVLCIFILIDNRYLNWTLHTVWSYPRIR
jgi:hypothetical protein